MYSENTVLAVDLDGTLIKTDLLHENIMQLISDNIFNVFKVLSYLIYGKAGFKKKIADQVDFQAELIPYREEVLEYIRNAKVQGRKVVLVSASDQSLVDAVASHLGLFDEAYGSNGSHNLGGTNKANFLIEKYGEGNFDYIGDANVDLNVWKKGRKAITVDAQNGLRKKVHKITDNVEHITSNGASAGSFRAYIKALRPHQWMKNALVFLPLLAAHKFDIETLFAAFVAFIVFSLTASSVYVLNDLLDLSSDRAHPRKCKRPFASGNVPIMHGLFMAPMLLIISIALSLYATQPLFILVLAVYYVLTFAYSLFLKRKLIVDIFTLSILYTLRVIAGAAATALIVSPWMLAFSGFIFLSLAAVKRQAELIDKQGSGQQEIPGRSYRVDDLDVVTMMALAAGYNAVLVLALYLNSPDVKLLYQKPYLMWGACPILLYWVSRVVMIAHRGHMHDDPLVFAVRDRNSLACGLGILICVLLASMI